MMNNKRKVAKFWVCTGMALAFYVGNEDTPFLIKEENPDEETDFSHGHTGMMFQGYTDLHVFTSDTERAWTRADIIERLEFLIFVSELLMMEIAAGNLCRSNFVSYRNYLHNQILVGNFTLGNVEERNQIAEQGIPTLSDEDQTRARQTVINRCSELGLQPSAVFGPPTGVMGGLELLTGFNKPTT